MGNILNLRFALYVIAAVLALVGIGNAFVATFFRSNYEIVYNFEVTAAYCAKGYCAYSAHLTIANTGHKNQDKVVVAIAGLPPDLGGSPQVLNLSADEPRTDDPVIEQKRSGDVNIIRISNFTPGALLEFSFMGSFPQEQLPAEDQPGVNVSGKGRIIEGDPRAITFLRYIT